MSFLLIPAARLFDVCVVAVIFAALL